MRGGAAVIPLWAIKLAGCLALAAVLWGHGDHHGTAAVRAKWQAAAAAELAKVNAESNRRAVRLQENVDAAELKKRQAEADARALRNARDGLLDAAERAGAAACHSAAASGGPATSAPAVVPADLFRSIEERAEQLAGAADAARIAGQLCESSYRALTR